LFLDFRLFEENRIKESEKKIGDLLAVVSSTGGHFHLNFFGKLLPALFPCAGRELSTTLEHFICHCWWAIDAMVGKPSQVTEVTVVPKKKWTGHSEKMDGSTAESYHT